MVLRPNGRFERRESPSAPSSQAGGVGERQESSRDPRRQGGSRGEPSRESPLDHSGADTEVDNFGQDHLAHLRHDPFPTGDLKREIISDENSATTSTSDLRYTRFMITGIPGEKQAILIPDTIPLDRNLLDEICDAIGKEPPNFLLSSVSSLRHPAALTTPQLRGCSAFEPLLAEARYSLDPEAESMSMGRLMDKARAGLGLQDRNQPDQEKRSRDAQRTNKSLEDFANRVLERKTAGMVGCIANAANQANAWIFTGPAISTFEVLLQQGRQTGDMEAFCAVAAHAQDSAYMDSSRMSRDLMTAIFDSSCELVPEMVEDFDPIVLSGDLWNPMKNSANREFHDYGFDYWSFEHEDSAEAQGHPSLQWPWPHADIFFLFFRQSPRSSSRGHVDWHFRTAQRFDSHAVPVDLVEIAPLGQVFIGGQTNSKWKLMHQIQVARPVLVLDNTPNVAKQFAILLNIIKSALAGERRKVAPFLLDGSEGGVASTAKQLLQAMSPSKLHKYVQQEFDPSGMEPSAVLTLNDVVGILEMAKQRMRAFQQNCIVLDPLTASQVDVTSQLSAMFCSVQTGTAEGGNVAASMRSLLLKGWQKHAMLARNAAQMRNLATALEVVIFLATLFATVLAVTLVYLRLKYNRIHEQVLRGALTDEQIRKILHSFPYTRITGVLNFWMLILPIAAGVLMSLRGHFQFSQKWASLAMAAEQVVSEIYLFLGGNGPNYSQGGVEARQAFLCKLKDIETFLVSAGIHDQDLSDDGASQAFESDPKVLQRHIEENVYKIKQPGWFYSQAYELLSLIPGYEGLADEGRQAQLGESSLEPTGPLQAEEFIQLRLIPLLKSYTRLSRSTASLRSKMQITLFLMLGFCTWLAAMDKPVWIPICFGTCAILGVLLQFLAPAEYVSAANDGIAALKHLDLQWHGCSVIEQQSEKMQQHVISNTEAISLAVATSLARVPLLPDTDIPTIKVGNVAAVRASRSASRSVSRGGSRGGTPGSSSLASSGPGTPVRNKNRWSRGGQWA